MALGPTSPLKAQLASASRCFNKATGSKWSPGGAAGPPRAQAELKGETHAAQGSAQKPLCLRGGFCRPSLCSQNASSGSRWAKQMESVSLSNLQMTVRLKRNKDPGDKKQLSSCCGFAYSKDGPPRAGTVPGAEQH